MSADGNARAADAVVAKLESQIVSGHLRDRSLLPAERELMEQFGTSRTVIREAITALSNRGLVESKPRFRPVVCKPNYATVLNATGTIVRHLLNEQDGIKNLYMSRAFIERGLVRQAATSAAKDDIKALRDALEANEQAIDDSAAFYRTDVAFHGALYRVPQNPVFPAIHEGYTSWLAPQWDQMERSPERNQKNFKAHKAILDAIIDRDPDEAERALDNHLKAAWEYVRITFDLEAL